MTHPHVRRLLALRASLLLVAGAVITFTAAYHDTVVSQWLFVGSVVAIAAGDLIVRMRSDQDRPARLHALFQGVLALLSVLATVVWLGNTAVLALTVTVWAALTAVLDVWAGWTLKNREDAREWTVAGIFAGLLAILLVLLPGNPVSVIGLFGGYAVVVGVYLAIAAADRVSPTEKASA